MLFLRRDTLIGLLCFAVCRTSNGLMPVLSIERGLGDEEVDRDGRLYWQQVDVVKRLLRYVVPRTLTGRNEVAIAGSAALHWYQGQNKVGPVWTDIGDIDIFVAGHNGSTKGSFKGFVLSVVERIQASKHTVETIRWYTFLVYGPREGKEICICDVKVKDVDLMLSFVQSPGYTTVRAAVGEFDIDICQVMYDIHGQGFELSAEAKDNIRAGIAIALPMKFGSQDGNVSLGDITRVRKTLQRMRKYHARGFAFTNGGGVMFGSDVGPGRHLAEG